MYKRVLVTILLVLFVTASLFAATTGKIRGVITDKETKEPLPGANIVIVGSSMGAATDINGNFIILNVPAGTYSLRGTFVGYSTLTISNVKVMADVTTDINFAMPPVALEGESITIVAEKPLVDKNITNTTKTIWAEDLENLPVRSVAGVVATLAGAVDQGGLHVRGGRTHETARYVDGMLTTSLVDGDDNMSIVDRAIEMIDFQAGGFTAEYGFANSGVIHTTIKSGTPEYHLSLEAISDDFWASKDAKKGYTILGMDKVYSYGYNNYYFTLGGPIVPSMKNNLRFYVAAQHYFRDSPATRFQGWQQDELWLKQSWNTSPKGSVTDSINLAADIPPGRLPGGGNMTQIVNGNVVWDFQPFRIKVGGTYARGRSQSTPIGNPRSLYEVADRGTRTRSSNYSGYLQFTHNVNSTMFYTINMNYFYNGSEAGDPIWDNNLLAYGDSKLNSALADTGIQKQFKLPLGTALLMPGYPTNAYTLSGEAYQGVKLDLTKQFGKRHEVKVGGEFNYYTLRYYGASSTLNFLQSIVNMQGSQGKITEISPYTAYRSLFLRNYGYDIYGNKINDDQTYTANVAGNMVPFGGLDGPAHPILAGLYLQDKIELQDLIINAGVRLDYFDKQLLEFKDLRNIQFTSTGFFDETSMQEAEPTIYASPRLGFSFPVTDHTVFHAQYGKFVQMNRFDNLFESYGYMNQQLSGGYAREQRNPNLRPERTTQYEFGFRQQFGANAALDATIFYKNTDDLISLRKPIPVQGATYSAPYLYLNEDFGTVKGLSLDFTLRRWQKVSANFNYTLAFAEGTGSSQSSHFDIAWAESDPTYPTTIMPLDFDIRHKGTVLTDIRFAKDDGPEVLGMRPLADLGLNAMFSFHSGAPYTRILAGSGYSEVFGYTQANPIEGINSSHMPWFFQLDAKLDKTFDVGPLDLNLYLWALNVLDMKSVTEVFSQTGRPDSDGHTQTEDGKVRAEKYPQGVDEYIKWYQATLTNCGVFGWQTPREIRLGVKIDF